MTATAAAAVAYPVIDHDVQGAPVFAGATMKVVELVMAQRAHGWKPEGLCFQFPHISMADIHAAFAYFWDHESEFDEDIARRSTFAEDSRRQSASLPVAQCLAALKHRR